jgi:hypothetical protein
MGDPQSKIRNPQSKIQNPKSKIQNPYFASVLGVHLSVQSLTLVLCVMTVSGCLGGGSAQTVSAVGRMAKAASNPQLKNLRIVKQKIGVFS